ncbi:hypothetical protein F8M41_013235 [Gigaspora margarita]|uniref:Uncharacterized protein n=1 Tax=Gigaspora margarita TaxID=4874 RepID=A0A8H3WWY9_GIGMA|nr:hypothetical protein F8M41_013235 [Gigaspora margarita]
MNIKRLTVIKNLLVMKNSEEQLNDIGIFKDVKKVFKWSLNSSEGGDSIGQFNLERYHQSKLKVRRINASRWLCQVKRGCNKVDGYDKDDRYNKGDKYVKDSSYDDKYEVISKSISKINYKVAA